MITHCAEPDSSTSTRPSRQTHRGLPHFLSTSLVVGSATEFLECHACVADGDTRPGQGAPVESQTDGIPGGRGPCETTAGRKLPGALWGNPQRYKRSLCCEDSRSGPSSKPAASITECPHRLSAVTLSPGPWNRTLFTKSWSATLLPRVGPDKISTHHLICTSHLPRPTGCGGGITFWYSSNSSPTVQ